MPCPNFLLGTQNTKTELVMSISSPLVKWGSYCNIYVEKILEMLTGCCPKSVHSQGAGVPDRYTQPCMQSNLPRQIILVEGNFTP